MSATSSPAGGRLLAYGGPLCANTISNELSNANARQGRKAGRARGKKVELKESHTSILSQSMVRDLKRTMSMKMAMARIRNRIPQSRKS